MANVSGGKPALETVDRANSFLSATEAKLIAFSYSDERAQRHVGLAAVFGKDPSDGQPAVFVLKSPADMTDVKIASPLVRDGIRRILSGDLPTQAEDVPAHLVGKRPGAAKPVAKAKKSA